jgi:hypothetical protein
VQTAIDAGARLVIVTSDSQPGNRPVTPYYGRFSTTFRGILRETMDNGGGEPPPDFVERLTRALHGR